jgi:tetratricopeptide (TPR) repeat protein
LDARKGVASFRVSAGSRALLGALLISLPPALGGCQSVGPIAGLGAGGSGGEASSGQRAVSFAKGSMANTNGRSKTTSATYSGSIGRDAQEQNIASLSEILRRNPQDVSTLNMRGAAYARIGRYRPALRDFSAAIELDGNYYQAYANRALLYVKMKNPDAAMADYQRALEIRPDYVNALLGRADLYRQSRIYARALADYGKAIEIDPSSDLAYYQRAVTYQLMNRHENAINDFDIAISLRPTSPAPYYGRGQSLFALGEYERAYDDFYVAARRGKKNIRAWTYRGLAAEKFGDPKKAKRAYLRALQINPNFPPASQGLKRVTRGAA